MKKRPLPIEENTDDPHQTKAPKTSLKTTKCCYCGKEFKTPGLKLHQNRCKSKPLREPHVYKFCILNEHIFERVRSSLHNQTLTKLQMITGDKTDFTSTEQEGGPNYKPRVTTTEARAMYKIHGLSGIPCEIRKYYTLYDREALNKHMLHTFGPKLEWLRMIEKKPIDIMTGAKVVASVVDMMGDMSFFFAHTTHLRRCENKIESFRKYDDMWYPRDEYQYMMQPYAIQKALRNMNLESSNMMFATCGETSFDGKCLHALDSSKQLLNPYQEALTRLGRVLVEFDDDRSIQVWGFGDAKTPADEVFSFTPENTLGGCKSFNEIWHRYHDITPTVTLGEKPVNLGPVLRHATAVAREVAGFHMLVILVSSQLADQHLADTAQAIVDASMLPLSTIVIGVGDGPWDNMKTLDDQLPQRQFDNFQFVNFQNVMHTANEETKKVLANRIQDSNAECPATSCELDPVDLCFTLQILMEVPVQYDAMCKLNLL
ncbi:hypothetical protein BBO99_00004772 [Phytophthora kernoviae]|uniref:Copine C-terminal domain-containing protein n=2 Tax=Phytophthora kernoviae TaxID=325452 RepID=A0A3R7HX07_9STRA|nr:hypothetical protein G195_008605 [Phytophthora kernoviae 00238/432]KAG2524422.1 hypothetical protein JM18_005384 [Phytophthora kernoviae]RLN10883.1 hypothetical protein BBI17_004871 [Phytophthora kernoviae]RLN80086.1 hypothetical protein BBO99_00004772 [Phytophthora kernoviae]